MFDGKTFFGATGTPRRKMALVRTRFEDWLPEPLIVATRMVKSLTAREGIRGCYPPLPGLPPLPAPERLAHRQGKLARGTRRFARTHRVPSYSWRCIHASDSSSRSRRLARHYRRGGRRGRNAHSGRARPGSLETTTRKLLDGRDVRRSVQSRRILRRSAKGAGKLDVSGA